MRYVRERFFKGETFIDLDDVARRTLVFLIDDDTHEIVEPALFFLVDAYLTQTGSWNRNTAKRAAYDLLDWWRFLDHHGRSWDLVDGRDLGAYPSANLHVPLTMRGCIDYSGPPVL